MKTYEIKKTDNGKQVIVYYDENGDEETTEHYANKEGVIQSEIKKGYVLKEK